MKFSDTVLFSLTVCSKFGHAARPSRHIPHFPRQLAGFNSSSQGALTATSSSTQDETDLEATSTGLEPPVLPPGGTLLQPLESGISSALARTSDETSSQISGNSALPGPTNQSSEGGVTFTSEPLGSSSTTITLVHESLTPARNSSRESTTTPRTVSPSSNFHSEGVRSSTSSTLVSMPTSFSNVSVSIPNKEFPDTLGGDQPVTRNDGGTSAACITTSEGAVPTTWTIIYTSTTTFYGDRADYTPPGPEITIPSTCEHPSAPSGKSRVSPPMDFSCVATDGVGDCAAPLPTMMPTTMSSPKVNPPATVTFVTTAKNPSVVFSPISTPRYGHSQTHAPQDRKTAQKPSAMPESSSTSPAPPRESAKQPARVTYKITVAPTKVIINDQTFIQSSPSATVEVTVEGEEFTINPSEVIGGGTIINRPGNAGRSTVVPTSTSIEDIAVVVAPSGTQSAIVIDGTTLELRPTPFRVVVRGQTVTIQPSNIALSGHTITISRSTPVQTEIVVAGGEMITAIGSTVMVIRSTTLTYGLASSTRTETVDDDTILIGPSGVVVHNTTLGGRDTQPSATAFEIAGGATITQIGASVVVVGDATFTVGPGQGTTTTVIGGESVTVGPSGVAVSTLSFTYPFGPTVITTISAPTASAPMPSETKTNGGTSVRNAGGCLEFCIAICAWVLGQLV